MDVTPDEVRERFDAIVAGEAERDPWYRLGKVIGAIFGTAAALILALLFALLILMCAGVLW